MTMPNPYRQFGPADLLRERLTNGRGRVLVVAATLEAAFSFCLGCMVFSWLMRAGMIPQAVCLECGDLSRRLAAATS